MNNKHSGTALVMKRAKYVLDQENISLKDFSEKTGITVRRLKTLLESDRSELRLREYSAIGDALGLPLDYFSQIDDSNQSFENQMANCELLYKLFRMSSEERKECFAFVERKMKEDGII